LVLFDIDGTLIRGAGPQHKHALIDGIRNVTGLSTDLDGIPTSGTLDRDLIVSMLARAGYTQQRICAELSRIMAECQNSYCRNCSMDLSPFLCAGVHEIMRELTSRGAVLGLVTGNLSQIGWRKMELAGLRTYFSIGAFAQDGSTRARLARIAAQRAKKQGLVTRTCAISLIGDHPNDVLAAKANRFRSVAVASGLASSDELRAAEPDYLVRDLTELDPAALL
jgi:phosphoglycolate phosphatase-like HAD superfamily hydrolase